MSPAKRLEESKSGCALKGGSFVIERNDPCHCGNEPIAPRIYDIGTDPRPTEKALLETSMTTGGVVQPERKPTVTGSRALANRAFEMDNNNADALLLQAEIEEDYDRAVE